MSVDSIAGWFHQGGILVMSGILITLLVSLVIIVERIMRYWFKYDMPNASAFMSHIQKNIMNNSIENAIRNCKKYRPKMVAVVLGEGLKRANDSTEEIENAIDHATLKVVPEVAKYVSFLSTTANVATLLGLLGTIFGLMHSFSGAATATGAAKQTILAEGIAEALTATSFGLGTALLCLFFYGVLMYKQQQIVAQISQCSARLRDLLYTRKMKIKGFQEKKSS